MSTPATTSRWRTRTCSSSCSGPTRAGRILDAGLVLLAYDYVLKSSHTFNLLDARGAISVTERTGYIGRVRALACRCAAAWRRQREDMGFPLMGRFDAVRAGESFFEGGNA